MRNFADADEYAKTVYAHPEYLHYLKTSKPMSEYVTVDLELWGCPVNKAQVMEVIVALLQQPQAQPAQLPVCLECKRRGTVCVLVVRASPASARLPRRLRRTVPGQRRGCYGCFGPIQRTELQLTGEILLTLERYPGEAARLFRGIQRVCTRIPEGCRRHARKPARRRNEDH